MPPHQLCVMMRLGTKPGHVTILELSAMRMTLQSRAACLRSCSVADLMTTCRCLFSLSTIDLLCL